MFICIEQHELGLLFQSFPLLFGQEHLDGSFKVTTRLDHQHYVCLFLELLPTHDQGSLVPTVTTALTAFRQEVADVVFDTAEGTELERFVARTLSYLI